jgi:2-aminoethylphosphonate-pyruvate transaminase
MTRKQNIPHSKDNLLFTPGPLTTSRTVKQAMLRDLGSRDNEFIEIVADIRQRLLALGGVSDRDYTTVLMQGSGAFGVEAVLSSTVSPTGKVLIVVNGAYGQRMVQMAQVLKLATHVLTYPENTPVQPTDVEHALAQDAAITHVAVVHCETTTGLLNPVEVIGAVVQRHGWLYFVDAMSSFGGAPINMAVSLVFFLQAF